MQNNIDLIGIWTSISETGIKCACHYGAYTYLVKGCKTSRSSDLRIAGSTIFADVYANRAGSFLRRGQNVLHNSNLF